MLSTFTQYHDLGLLVLRLTLGFIFVYHGWPKFRKPESMAAGLGWPKAAVMTLGVVEMLAGLGVVLGVYMQLAALIMALTMLGALYHKIFKWKVSFWSQTNTGWEFDLINLAAALFLLTSGAGAYAF